MKETLFVNEAMSPLALKALEIIKEEQALALKANLTKAGVDVLMEHLTRYQFYIEFAVKLGLINKCLQ